VKIESYSFGVLTFGGVLYRQDLIILGERVLAGWRRLSGHSLAPADLEDVMNFRPEILVVGRGSLGVMKVPPSTFSFLEKEGIEVIAERTAAACRIFNAELHRGRNAAGAFHLTC
jgi:hypothetical protein